MNNSFESSGAVCAEIVSIGTELLLGEITDTNASWIAARLPALGIPVYRIQQTGDNQARLTQLLREAWSRAELLILTGGLGPTEDDVTREAIADLLGEQMHVVPELEAQLRQFFSRRNRIMPERNVKQATVVESAEALLNPVGTAPGWWVSRNGHYIATMPGVPNEMRRMWDEQVVPRLLTLRRGGTIVKRTLKILGIGESAVEQDLGDLVRGVNPTVATYAKPDGIHVRIAARSADSAEAEALLLATEQRVRAIFGASIYGVDGQDLGSMTAERLAEQGVTAAVAEAGTAGALTQALGGGILAGTLVLPEYRAEDAKAEAYLLAQRARDTFHTALGIGVLVIGDGPTAQRVAAALITDSVTVCEAELHNTDAHDAPRRAQLLALRLLRETKFQVKRPF